MEGGFDGKISQHLGAVLKTHAPYHSTFNVNANVDYQIIIWKWRFHKRRRLNTT